MNTPSGSDKTPAAAPSKLVSLAGTSLAVGKQVRSGIHGTVSNLRGKKSFLGEVGKMDEIFKVELYPLQNSTFHGTTLIVKCVIPNCKRYPAF